MSARLELTAKDGHRLSAYRSDPAGAPKGAIVMLHAVFGLTERMAQVCDRFASVGYIALAPALYDRAQRDRVYPYAFDSIAQGSVVYQSLTEDMVFADIAACADAAQTPGRVAIGGFCSGGSWSWKAGAKMDFAAQVNFYGSHVPALIDWEQRCPTILHYGDKDHVVWMSDIEAIRRRHPRVELHVYPKGAHAFENPAQHFYDSEIAELAWLRSIAFLDRVLAR